MKKLVAFAVVITVVLAGIGCNGRNPVGAGEQGVPELPPPASMTIPSMGSTEALAKTSAPQSTIAFSLACCAVGFWTATVQIALLEPVALFALCHSATPVPLPDNSGWTWIVRDNSGFSATLTGRIGNNMALWEMSVTGGPLVNFVWFTGTSVITGRAGSWTFYDTAKVNGVCKEVIRFSYEIISAKNTVQVLVVDQTSPDKGSYLQWTEAGNAMTFEAYGAQKAERYVIAWDKVTEAGSVTNMVTCEKACWDTRWNGHRDIVCP